MWLGDARRQAALSISGGNRQDTGRTCCCLASAAMAWHRPVAVDAAIGAWILAYSTSPCAARAGSVVTRHAKRERVLFAPVRERRSQTMKLTLKHVVAAIILVLS